MNAIFDFLSKLFSALINAPVEAPTEPEPEAPAPAPEAAGWPGSAPWEVLDVSKWQGAISWDSVAASGKCAGLMLRALGNRSGKPYIDECFEDNYTKCTKLGIPVGVYYYSCATTKQAADAERAMLKKALAGKTLQLPVALDIEDERLKKLDKAALTDLVAYELKELENLGFYALLYTYLSFAQNYLFMGGAALKPYDVWLAAYRKTRPNTDYDVGMWQYTSTATMPGINGNVDMSLAYRNYPAIIAKKGLDRLREDA